MGSPGGAKVFSRGLTPPASRREPPTSHPAHATLPTPAPLSRTPAVTRPTAEETRLRDQAPAPAHWRPGGPYVADRQWGTVREDYSADGNAWSFFPHDHARSRAYRWGEDALAGWCDRYQLLVLGFALWNGRDPILKERLFGLNPWEANHGED